MRAWGLLLISLSSAFLTVSCSEDDPPAVPSPLDSGADFVAIPRHLSSSEIEKRNTARAARALPPTTEDDDFYIAVKRSHLNQRWFLSAYLEQYFPGAVTTGAAHSLGTRVISFREQNGKLFVFDAGDGLSTSDVFDPELLVEAYPIVDDEDVQNLRHADEYVVFDPAAGLNRFGVVSDVFADNRYEPEHFQVELSFLQHFRALGDGIIFEQVFTGYADMSLNTNAPLALNAYQGSGTLSIALRKYKEGAGFQPRPADDVTFYFLDNPHLDPATGKGTQLTLKWNIKPGMRPIKWLISPEIGEYLAAHPELAGVDVVGAVKRGIESWNDAFGFRVFEAEVASSSSHFGDDDKNYIIFDPGPGTGYAFADFRSNPNTGELRGADVYFGSDWLSLHGFSDDPAPPSARPSAPPAVPALVWGNMRPQHLCVRSAEEQLRIGPADDGSSQLTAKQKLTIFLQHVIAHEVGHTLGLRHNFEGSLVPPSTSVMDYLTNADSVAVPTPGSYDVAAVRWLYGLSPDRPTQPFCNDDGVTTDPLCRMFDRGADPLNETYARIYGYIRGMMLDGRLLIDFFFDAYSEGLLGYVRAGADDAPQRAYEILMAGIRAPVTAEQAADPQYARGADYMASTALMFLGSPELSQFARIKDLPTNEAVLLAILADERGILLNVDGIRTFPSRRLMVDLLKKGQSIEAYEVLLEARDVLSAQLTGGTLSASDHALTQDLLARVNQAVSPYFD
jgi:Met-zincin